MPLSFHSVSHGSVAFGFYNIETDGLLLQDHFFFCTDFCAAVVTLTGAPVDADAAATLPGHVFPDPARIGDLMGAIHGVRHTGYLGELYRRWPFPRDPAGFRQKLYGAENRSDVQDLLDRMAEPTEIPLRRGPRFEPASIGPYRFSRTGFAALLEYVVRGGHPTWEGYEAGRMPEVVRGLLPVIGQLRT